MLAAPVCVAGFIRGFLSLDALAHNQILMIRYSFFLEGFD
jgi:hypothetical protein